MQYIIITCIFMIFRYESNQFKFDVPHNYFTLIICTCFNIQLCNFVFAKPLFAGWKLKDWVLFCCKLKFQQSYDIGLANLATEGTYTVTWLGEIKWNLVCHVFY